MAGDKGNVQVLFLIFALTSDAWYDSEIMDSREKD